DPQGRLITEKIGDKTQKELFPGSPVTTQMAEVQRVQSQLQSRIDGAGDKKKQIALLAQILAPLVVTNEQREQMIAYQMPLRDDQSLDNQLAQLRGQLDQLFKDAQDTTRSVSQRKRAIARLLFNVAENLTDQ